MKDPASLGRALVACVDDRRASSRTELLREADDEDLGRLAFHALRHRVVPFLYLALRDAGIDDGGEAMTSLKRAYAVRAGEHLRMLADLDRVRQVLDDAEVPFLVIKGPAIAERLYPSPDLRPYDDIDLLVASASFERTIVALETAGFSLLDRNWDLIRQERRGQLHLRLDLGTLADVHWHLLNRETVREAFDVPTDDLFARSRPIELLGANVRTLDATDTLLHLCVHASLSGGDRLIWMKDIERAIAVDGVEWRELVERAERWRAGPTVAIALARARRVAGAAVPAAVLERLHGGRARAAIGTAVDRRWPVEASLGTVTPATLWAQIARASWTGTCSAAVSRAERRSRTLVSERQTDDARAPILRSQGGEADERAYLRDVTRSASEGETPRS